MKAGRIGGIEAVVKAINTHINNVKVCKSGCGMLGNTLANGKHFTIYEIISNNMD